MRPDRAVVVGHWIVARLAARHRADTPACEKMRPHQIGGDLSGAVFPNHAAEQQLPRVRCAYSAWLFGAIERECIGAELVAPERFFKTLGESQRFGLELVRHVALPEPQCAACRQPLAGEYIALHFRQCDTAFGKLAVGMEDGINGILPALVGQPLFGSAPILDKTVLVGIAGTIDPSQRRLDRGPQFGERFLVPGAFDVKTGQQNEQRCRIYTAIITTKRDFTDTSHLALTGFMQNLPRLSILPLVDLRCLGRCQMREDPFGDLRAGPQVLEGCDDTIPTEDRAVPRHASIRIHPFRGGRDQHSQIRQRAMDPAVELLV